MKDWEKWDFKDAENRRALELKKDIILEGMSTWRMRYEGVRFREDDEESIEEDLLTLFENKPENTIYVMHSPPYKTSLDITYSNDNVGSVSIKRAIENFQPFLTLHGHIHETVEMSNRFIDRIGDTICATPGNHNTMKDPYVLEIELPSRGVKRIKLG